MTDTEINIAIAEACGWQFVPSGDSPTEFGWKAFPESWLNSDGETDTIPDFVNDLNEMHKAEKTLQEGYEEMKRHRDALTLVCLRDQECYFTAPARQRAEAFLRVKGKWRDE